MCARKTQYVEKRKLLRVILRVWMNERWFKREEEGDEEKKFDWNTKFSHFLMSESS